MNSLHSSAQQRSPIRGVALRPMGRTAGDGTNSTAAGASLEALEAMQKDMSLLHRTLRSVLKATRTAAKGSAVQVLAFVVALFAMANMAHAQATYFWVGGGSTDWGRPTNWSLASGGAGGAGVPGFPYGNAQDVAIFDGNSGTNITILTGFPTNGAAASVGQIRLLNSLSTGPQVTFGGAGSTVATIRLGGVATSTNPPLFVGSLCRLFIDQNITLETLTNLGAAASSAAIFGDLSIRVGGTVTNTVASRFRIEDGGSLRMSGGTFTTAGAASAVLYALTGNRGSLVYDRNDNTTVTIPAPNNATELPVTVAGPPADMVGNLVIRRPVGSVTTFTDGNTYDLGGTLTVDGCPLSFPNNLTMNLAASRILNGGNIFSASTALNNNMFYRDLVAAAGVTPLNPTVSDLSFGINLAGTIPNGQYLNRLANSIPGMNLSINSDLNIVANGGAAAGILLGNTVAGGQLTIPATRTVTLRRGTGTIEAAMNTGRLIVNGTFAMATGATFTNNNTNINSPIAGILVNAGGRIQLNGTATINAGTVNGIFYDGPTATLEYLDRDASVGRNVVTFEAFTGTGAYAAPSGVRNATTQELPADMRGGVTVNRLYAEATGTPNIASLVAMQQNTTMSGPLTLTQGTFGLNGRQLILNGTITTNVGGGYLAGGNAAGSSALVYNSTANGTIAVTTASTAPHGSIFNYIEINNTGNLSFVSGQSLSLNGSAPNTNYGLNGVSNYNGQLRFNSTGNLILNAAQITFTGAGAANTNPATAQGGNIPITTASVGAIVGDGAARLIFINTAAGTAQIRSFPRFATGGQQLLELRVAADGTTMPSPGGTNPTLLDYMVSLRTPLQTSIVTLQNNAILQLANGANLTVLNPPDLATAQNVPNSRGNFIDASQGGSLQLRGYLTPGNVLIPVGVSFVDVNGGVVQSSYRPITVSNSITAIPGENYTVTATSNIVNLVPAIPSLANNSMRGQWNITSGSGVNGAGGALQVGWGNVAFPTPAMTVAGDEPNQFFTTLSAAGPPAGTTLTTIRRWTGATYTNVLPTNPVNGGTLANPRSIQATYNGALSNTVFIVSNELFPIYWVGGSTVAGDWGQTNNWASTSLGTPGSANPPGVNDWAVFDKAQAPRVTTNIPPNIQQMSVIEGANVTLAPTDNTRTMSINRDLANNDNLLIGPNSRLAIGTGTFPMTVTVPNTATANGPNTSVFGTLAILGNGTYNHADANSTILIANGGTLHLGTASASSLPAVATGFQKNGAGAVLRYGGNQNSTPPYIFGAPAEQNATLLYEDANGGTDIRTGAAAANGELPASPFPGNMVINKTVAGSVFGLVGNYSIASTATLQAGIWDLTQAFMGGGGFGLTVGTGPNPSVAAPGSRTLKITGTLPNTGLRGNVANSTLTLNGPGVADLQFVPGGEFLNALTMNDASNAAPNAALSAVLKTNLTVGAGNFVMTNARTAVNMDYGLTILTPHILRLQGAANTITSGRILNQGTVAVPTGGALALPATVAAGGLDIATTGTMNIINDGNVTGTAGVNPVRYLNVASRLLYSAEGAGLANKNTDDMVFPQIFNASLVIDKNFSGTTTTNTVTLNDCKVVTQGTVQLVGGDLLLNGQLFKIGSATQLNPTPVAADFLNNTISTTARLLPGGGRIFGDNAAGSSSFVYNSTQSANLWLGELNVAMTAHRGRFLNKLEINGPATLTLSTSAVVNIQSAGVPTCGGAMETTYQGTLRLDNSTGNLALNGTSLRFLGTVAPTAGQVLTTVTGGTITGDALPGTSIAITSERVFNIRMAAGAGSALRDFSLNPAATAPAVGQHQIALISSMTTDHLGVTRNIVSLASPSVNLTVTGTGTNSTSGNTTGGQAAFGLNNNNFIDLSPGGTLTMSIPNNTTRMFPIGVTNNAITFVRPAPLTITNQGGAQDTYTIGAQRGLTFQNLVYPDKVNVQWTIARGAASAMNQTVQFGWHTEHETAAPGFQRQNSFATQWNGTTYPILASALSSTMTASTPPGMEWSQTVAFPSVSMTGAANPFGVIAPPAAIIMAADSLSPSGSGGFNSPNTGRFASPNAGNLVITSGTPFNLRIGAFNGLNQPAPVRISLNNIRADFYPLPGGNAVFNTTGSATAALPFVLNVPNNPVYASTGVVTLPANVTVDWLNPGAASSTQAILRLFDPTGTLTSATLIVTINAPPLRPSTIAYTQVQGSSRGTVGFNGGGLGQFNITGGVSFPINFGLFSNANLLIPTTATTTFMATIESIPGVTVAGANLVPTPGTPQAPTTATVNANVAIGSLRPIFNWTNPPFGGGITKALVRLAWFSGGEMGSPQLGSTTVIVTLSTGGTVPVRLGYAVNSGDLLDANLATLGINGGATTFANPIIANQIIPVNFASFANMGAVLPPVPAPTQVQLSIAPDPINPAEVFSLEGTTQTAIGPDGTGTLSPRIVYNANSPTTARAVLTLSVVSGQTTLITTTAQVWVSTTGSLATRTSFNAAVGPTRGHTSEAIGGAGINGGNRNIPSGRPFDIDFGYFNASDVAALGGATPMQLSIVPGSIVPFTETVTLDGTTSINVFPITRQARLTGAILNWRNPTVAGPITLRIRLEPIGMLSGFLAPIQFTEATITLSTGATSPVALAMSQVSSTGTQGVNGGNLNIINNIPFNIDLGLFDANGVISQSLSNSSVGLTVEPVTAGQVFTVSGNVSGVFVNQSGIRLNNVAVQWTNPSAPTTQVRLRVSTTAGAGPIASTSVVVTLSAGSLFPTIVGFTPATGGPGSVVLISGANFTGVTSVAFGGVQASSFTVLGDGVISAVVPPGAVSGPITVSRPAGANFPAGSGTSMGVFTIGTPPSISSFSPIRGGTGTLITINGTNLGAIASILNVNVAGVAAAVQSINTTGTQMVVQITGTALTPRTAPITIATLSGTATSAQPFTFNLPPAITSVTPNSAIVNGQDIPIIIRGSNFDINLFPPPDAIQSGVYFSLNNTPQAISPSSRIAVQSVTPTEIRATISGTFNNMVGQRFITVLNTDGQYISIPFQLVPGGTPTLTSITPSVTSASGVAFVATITGTNFFGAAGTTVTANGSSISVLSASSTQIQVIIPESLNQVAATLNIVVRNSDGQQVQGRITITDPGRPAISSVEPARAVVGSPTTNITINGSGFFLNANVTFNNVPLQVLPGRSTTQIVAVIPANLLATFGTFPIRVTNPGGFSGAALFNVGYAPPIVTSAVTASGNIPGQSSTAASVFPFQLAVNGSGFRQGVTVTFNGTQLNIVSTSDTQVIAQVPSGLNGTQGVFPVVLSNADGLSSSATFSIGPPNAPVITQVSPTVTNATATPFVITLTGRNFASGPQNTPLPGFQVIYNGRPLQVLSVTPTQIIAFVPAGVNNQEGNIVVEAVNPDGQRSNRATINVLCAICPVITSVSPGALRPNYPFDVTFTINGSNFRPGATVTVGGAPLRIVSVADGQIIGIAPAGFVLSNAVIRVQNMDGTSFTLFDGYTVSVREVMTVESMTGSVYPNPMEDMINFEAMLPKAGQLRVRLTDVLGKTLVLFTQAVGAGKFTHQLDVSALPTGVYIFEMTDGERRFIEKVVKR